MVNTQSFSYTYIPRDPYSESLTEQYSYVCTFCGSLHGANLPKIFCASPFVYLNKEYSLQL